MSLKERWEAIDREGHVMWVVLVVAHVVLIAGFLGSGGLGFLTDALPVPVEVARTGMSINALLFFIASALTMRNLVRYRSRWTPMERTLSRGMFFVFWASGISALVRSLRDDALVTIVTPLIWLGLVLAIYALLDRPDRFRS